MRHARKIPIRGPLVTLVAAATLAGAALATPASAAPSPSPAPATAQPTGGTRTVPMPDGGSVSIAPDGSATRTNAQGKVLAQKTLPVPPGVSALGDSGAPDDDAVRAAFLQPTTQVAAGEVLAVLSDTTAVTGAPVAGRQATGTRAAITSNAVVNSAFAKVHADSVQPLFPDLPAAEATQLSNSARGRLGGSAPDLSKIVLVHLNGGDPTAAAKTLSGTPGVAYARPNNYVSSMSTGPTPLPSGASTASPNPAATPATQAGNSSAQPSAPSPLPDNYGLTSSLQSFLNAGGTNAVGAYSVLQSKFGQLPGAGEIITNVSIGDLTDQGMADAGDAYVSRGGPTTIIQDGQRYLDLPSMPLIPTYTAGPTGTLDPTGSTENQDPTLGEVLLDFGVMAPLPHAAQRQTAMGSGPTDLLGIAPGAKYRLVVPQQPTFDQVAVALLAAARQNPRPNVITASLGEGTDSIGFPSRYLEEDPVTRAVIAAIVQQYHIVVTISSNDGTRLYTPAAVGPDGGSTPTNTTREPGAVTNINDDAYSTTPTQVLDSGAIAVGGTTLDDTLAVSPQSGGPLSRTGTFATTRTDGGGNFSSGFGSRVNVSAPSDGIVAFEHAQGGSPQKVKPVLNGGTSASAPMTAAAAAVVLQAARLTGKSMSPADVRSLLESTGRAVATPPQIDQPITVGPQIDVTAAVSAVLGDTMGHDQQAAAPDSQGDVVRSTAAGGTSIARLSVAHRVTVGGLGGSFTENTDPGRIDLAGSGQNGEGLVGPVTIGADVVGLPQGGHPDYVLRIGGQEFHSDVAAIRLTPTEMLQAAGLPVVSTVDRTIQLTFEVRSGEHVLATTQQPLTFGPTDGTYVEALAPVAPATVKAGSPVKVHYDITGVRTLENPHLVVSGVGHWSPTAAPIFSAAYAAPLTGMSGDITIPADAFSGGGGIYGIGVEQRYSPTAKVGYPTFGEFTSIRVDGGTADQRPAAPTLAADGSGQFGHFLEIPRATPGFSLRYDVHGVPGATGAAVEVSAPAPTLFNSLNTVTNANGTVRDDDGVNAGSVAYQQLPGRNGTASLDAVKLGLGGSLDYNLRVFPTDKNGKVIGQASPTSMLTLDDGLTPDGDLVGSFAVEPGGTSVVALRNPDGSESLREYQSATGAYGPVLATDTSPANAYQVLGVDQGAHRAAVLHSAATGSSLETYDTATGQQVNAAPATGYTVVGGRVDAVRHRAAVLAHRTADNADVLLPLSLSTGTLGSEIPIDGPGAKPGSYLMIEVDQATGEVYVSRGRTQAVCFGGGIGAVAKVNLDSGAIVPAPSATVCGLGLGVDDSAGKIYQLSYQSFSVNILGNSVLSPLSGDTLESGDSITVRQQSALGLAVDAVHHLALVAFQSPPVIPLFGTSLLFDNNAMSQLAVVDLTSGKTVSVVSGLNYRAGFFGGEFNKSSQRSIQLDPAGRTGWTYSPDGLQIQQFRY